MSKAFKIGITALSVIGAGILYSLHKKSRRPWLENNKHQQDSNKSSKKPGKKLGTEVYYHYQSEKSNQSKKPTTQKTRSRKEKRRIKRPKKSLNLQQWNTWLQRTYQSTQISINNTSTEEKTIRLWGAGRGTGTHPSTQTHPLATGAMENPVSGFSLFKTTQTGIHPQDLIINPANKLIYIANQLSNSVSVITLEGKPVTQIPLTPSIFPGFNSPVALAVNTSQNSQNFGKVYVVGSVSNTVSVIGLDHKVKKTIPVGIRPVAIAYNPMGQKLYVANLVSGNLSIIDTKSETVSSTLDTGKSPVALAIKPENGEVYVVDSIENSLTVFDTSSRKKAQIPHIGTKLVAIAYQPDTHQMYIVAEGSDAIIPIDTNTHTPLAPIPVGHNPGAIAYNQVNGMMYAVSREDQTLTVIDKDKKNQASLPQEKVITGLAFNAQFLYALNPSDNTLSISTQNAWEDDLQTDQQYHQTNRSFQHAPALIKHVRLVYSGQKAPKALRLIEQRITGTCHTKSLSLKSYHSPQHSSRVLEVFGLNGSIIGGRHSWMITLAAHQRITLLIHYYQPDKTGLYYPNTASSNRNTNLKQ